MKDYYDILGVSRDASEDDIKKAYKKIMLKYHPDRMGNKSDKEKKEAEEIVKSANEAYETLSDPQKKQEYDNPGFGGGFNPFADFFGHDRSNGQSWHTEDYRDLRGKNCEGKLNIDISFIQFFLGRFTHFFRCAYRYRTFCNDQHIVVHIPATIAGYRKHIFQIRTSVFIRRGSNCNKNDLTVLNGLPDIGSK